ncbi:hypothetical protein IEO21_01702 [Rhodonia placenta]|uniref:Ubiquitin-like domain-containing protein n=1 Tax=Rhodonia placenta TaxID=104341 RepID=A0A8H7U536_9APHY|nr:hypothetical protein IEO21_01702 [Postia placenta]
MTQNSAMNGAQSTRHGRPAPAGATPPAPAAAPPAPPTHPHAQTTNRQPNGTAVNGAHPSTQKGKKKAADPPPVDPSQMYETLKNRIAALEEEEVHEEEEEKRFELKRLERDHAKEKQKLAKDKDADIVVRVLCKYRAELYFKISRKTKLSRLFNAWTERMESGPKKGDGKGTPQPNGTALSTTPNSTSGASSSSSSMQFIFTHGGRSLDTDQTPEEAGIEEGDVILAVEIMDLTEGPGTEEVDEPEPRRQKLKKEWVENPREAKKTVEEIFDGPLPIWNRYRVRERLKEVLRQYELRERHFECVIRSKELEVLLSRARAAEQKQVAEGEKSRADKLEEEVWWLSYLR